MQGKDAIHSPLLVKTLVGHFVHQDKFINKPSGSLVLDLACKYIVKVCTSRRGSLVV